MRFRVETVLTGLEVPWSMNFAPDGRLFITERPGRVRIATLGGGSSELALTLDGVYTQGEAGLLGLALDPGVRAESIRLSLLLGDGVWRRRQSHRPLSRGQLATR